MVHGLQMFLPSSQLAYLLECRTYTQAGDERTCLLVNAAAVVAGFIGFVAGIMLGRQIDADETRLSGASTSGLERRWSVCLAILTVLPRIGSRGGHAGTPRTGRKQRVTLRCAPQSDSVSARFCILSIQRCKICKYHYYTLPDNL